MTGWPAATMQRAADAGLRTAATFWLPRFQAELDLLPRPADRSRQQAQGPDPVRVLILGNGIANGFGVRTQDLALPGALARALRDRTGRGVEVDLDARRGMRVEALLQRVDDLRVWRYDAVVVTVGPTDAAAVLPVGRWCRSVQDLLAKLHSSLGPNATLLALGMAPMQRPPRGADWMSKRVDAYAGRLDEGTLEAVDGLPDDVTFVPLRPILQAAGEAQYSSAFAYAQVAERLADLLAPRLPGVGDRALRHRTDDEESRLVALEQSGLLDARPSERLAKLVRSARTMFGVRGASLTVVGRDRLRIVSASGVESDEVRARSGTLIDRVLRSPGLYELDDVAPAFCDALPQMASGPVRYYAGLTVEAPSGHAVGALCLFHDQPRGPGSVDEALMRDLVAGIQTELWEAVAVRG